MKKGMILGVALLASCGATSSMKAAAPGGSPTAVATAGDSAPSPADPVAAGPAAPASEAKIATGEMPIPEARPQAGQLTAGVWDDNLNFGFFQSYAARMGPQSQDLGAFGVDEQRAAHDAFERGGQARRELDVQLVLDTTGSMGDELRYLQSEFDSISKQIHARFPDVQPRWSLVLYKDRGDAYVTRPFDFTGDTMRFQRDLAAQSAGGGGDFPEAVVPAFEHALAQRWRQDPAVAKLIFWVADAPPHPGEGGRLAQLARRARDMGVHVYPVASSGIDDATEYQMRATAQLTGGRYLFLTDDSHIGNGHAEPHIPCYAVSRLDHAVVRMVETEMQGQRAPLRKDEVIRRVGAPDGEGKCTVHEMQVVAF